MNTVTFARTHYIYEVDNIPDHRSRRFGCCPCQMAVRRSERLLKKSRIRAATQIRQMQNEPLRQQFNLPYYHTIFADTKQDDATDKGQFSQSNSFFIIIKENCHEKGNFVRKKLSHGGRCEKLSLHQYHGCVRTDAP